MVVVGTLVTVPRGKQSEEVVRWVVKGTKVTSSTLFSKIGRRKLTSTGSTMAVGGFGSQC